MPKTELTFFSRSSFSFVHEVSYWLFSVVATFSLLFNESMRAFLLVVSSDKVLTCRNVAQRKEGKNYSGQHVSAI